jgi:hypothetical protein
MKKFTKYLAALILFASLGLAAQAADIYDRTAMSTIATNGTATWTNTVLFGSIELKRISLVGMNYITDTVTVARVTATDTTDTRSLTNTVIGIVCAANVGSSNLIVAAGSGPVYMKYGDKLTFTSGMGSNGYYYVEYLKQPR